MIECLIKLICGRYIRFDCSKKKEDWLVNIPLYMIEKIANL